MKRQVWALPKTGHLSQLQLEEEQLPNGLECNRVRVDVKAIGLNFADVFQVLGFYSAIPSGKFIPGLEFAGTIVESNSPKFKQGDRVMGVTRFGAFATIIDVNDDYILHMPENWSFAQGSGFLVQALTAWFGLQQLARILDKPNSTVLIHSAAGGVGYLSLKLLATMPQVNIVGTVGSSSKRDWLTSQFSEIQSRLRIVTRREGTYKRATVSPFEQDCRAELKSMGCIQRFRHHHGCN
jgi:NADPH:quinone reductase-like Zn-dependent oxidoreductase